MDEFFFSVGDIVNINGLQVIKKNVVRQGNLFGDSIEFAGTKGNIVVSGILWERTSYEDAHNALMLELVSNSMSHRMRVETFKVNHNDIGDFSVINTRFNSVTKTRIDDPSELYFVRGTKAIKLYGKDDADVRPIAKVLDELLKQPPGKQKPTAPPAPQAPDTKK